ncbi:MAG: hemin uptake protein HemP [Rhodocyclales bacterium]|nr:hemin uptake protein HemP [Rhodocyclales bacterium]
MAQQQASQQPTVVVVGADKSRAPLISSAQLFGTHRTVLIDHQGQCYTLRLTRENKLILTK